jgi:hypothetical protein
MTSSRTTRTTATSRPEPLGAHSLHLSQPSRAPAASATPRVYTARYANPTLADHPAAKVRITLGAPRLKLPYRLHKILELAPTWSMLHKPEAEFDGLYTELLYRRGGVDFFLQRFAQVAVEAGVDSLALLCYEDIQKPGVWCHRRILSAWLEEWTGQVVEELPEV